MAHGQLRKLSVLWVVILISITTGCSESEQSDQVNNLSTAIGNPKPSLEDMKQAFIKVRVEEMEKYIRAHQAGENTGVNTEEKAKYIESLFNINVEFINHKAYFDGFWIDLDKLTFTRMISGPGYFHEQYGKFVKNKFGVWTADVREGSYACGPISGK